MYTKRLLFICGYAVIWSALLFGSLKISELPLQNIHSFCGPWGCAAAPNVLLSVHAMWASLIVPLGVLVVWAINALRDTTIWKVALMTSLFILAAFVAYDLFSYFYFFEGEIQFVLKRGLFLLVTASDFPIVQLSFATAINWILCKSVLLRRPDVQLEMQALRQTVSR